MARLFMPTPTMLPAFTTVVAPPLPSIPVYPLIEAELSLVTLPPAVRTTPLAFEAVALPAMVPAFTMVSARL